VVRDFYLGEFFGTWGQPLSSQQILAYHADDAHTITMTVNGQPSAAFGSLVLHDLDNIVIRYDRSPGYARAVVAAALASSDESFRNLVSDSYQRFLARSTDAAGADYWIARLRHGLTDEQLEASFLGSPEYGANHGGDWDGWLRGMYTDLLGRSADDAGLAYWTDRLSNGARPGDVALGFAAGTERETARVIADYSTYLGRSPGQPEIDY